MPALTLLLVASLQNPIVLPPRQAPPRATQQEPSHHFEQDVAALRRSRLRPKLEEETLTTLAVRYPDLASRAAALLRTADPDLAFGLLRVLERFGSQDEAAAIAAVATTRPLGAAAQRAMEVLALLAGEDAKEALFRCLIARTSGTRRAAADQLKPRLGVQDAARVLELMQRDGELRALGLWLLGATPAAAARTTLLSALATPDVHAATTACESLVEHGPDLAQDLQALVERAALDRSFGYAAVALTRLELAHGVVLLAPSAAPFLRQEVDSNDRFMRVAAAVALAQLSYRSGDEAGDRFGDRAIIDGLLLVVAPGAFVPSYGLLHPLANRQLRRLTGRAFDTPTDWQSWWTAAREGFVGLRQTLAMDEGRAAVAALTLRTRERVVHVRGERAPEPSRRDESDELYFLPASEMLRLVQRLQDAGFMSPALEKAALPTEATANARSLELRVGSARSTYEADDRGDAWMERFVADITSVAARERWQLYPSDGTDFLVFWRQERDWQAQHQDRADRDRRLKDLVIAALPRLRGAQRSRALEHLNDVPEVAKLLDAEDGAAIAAAVRASGSIDADGERLLAMAMRIPNDDVAKAAIDVVDALADAGGRDAMPRLFAILGPERVLHCLMDPRPRIKIAAMHEVANMRELRAVPALLAASRDADPEVQQTAIFALGALRAEDARRPLLDALPTLTPAARRVAWVALGRIGGEGVFPAIVRGTTSDEVEDRRAAIAALGKLDEPMAADYLASLFEVMGQSPLGTQVLAALQDQGALRARAALRKSLQQGRDNRVRAELVQVLGDFNDPLVVPDLIEQLDDARLGDRATVQLSAITGVDLLQVDDRKAFMYEWFARHKNESQAAWFLGAVRAAGIPTDLDVAWLQPRAGVRAVPELARIMTETDRPHLRLLALALLRDTTQRDFGPLSPQARPEELVALADRYRFYAESVAATDK